MFLYPGQLTAFAGKGVISTILGTCVSVCLWSRGAELGGMNHFLLPYRVGTADPSPKYGHIATQTLIDQLLGLGAPRSSLAAKVFGGMNSTFHRANGDLGQMNVQIALELLEQERIPVIAQDVGGPKGRKLVFETHTGRAWVKTL